MHQESDRHGLDADLVDKGKTTPSNGGRHQLIGLTYAAKRRPSSHPKLAPLIRTIRREVTAIVPKNHEEIPIRGTIERLNCSSSSSTSVQGYRGIT